MPKRLFRSNENKVVAGVCGGIGEYFDIDPVLIRVITVVLFFLNGFGLLAYIVGWIVIPKREEFTIGTQEQREAEAKLQKTEQRSGARSYLPGIILIAIGGILLVRENWYWFDWHEIWPLILIGIGVVLMVRKTGREEEATAAEQSNGNTVNADNGGNGS